MPREFIDSINPESELQLSACLHTANQLGFSEIWISNLTKAERVIINNPPFITLIKSHIRLDIGLVHESREEMISILRHKRRLFPIIAITCIDPEIAAWAAQDNRVDILKFPIFQLGHLMTRSIAKLMLKFHKFLEIPLSELYSLPERHQIPALRQIRSALEIATLKKVPVLFTSGSSRADQMRSPRDLAALVQILLANSELSLDSLSKIPRRLIQKNLFKISSNYIAPGVFKSPPKPKIKEEEE
ncbi:MAG: RNase P subunit p30 family protein [Candidatus Hermodarchaeota archaeon]